MSLTSVAYYPGCSGGGTSAEYEKSTQAVFRTLGVRLEELADWSCCGSTPAHTVNHVLSAALSARNLAIAATAGHSVVTTPCPSCLSNLRTAAHKMEDEGFRRDVSALLHDGDAAADIETGASVDARSTLQVIAEEVGNDAVAARVRKPLKGLKVACYYGCIMNRPPELMQFDDAEHPMAMDRLMEACGAEVVPFPLKVECCGAAFGMPRRDIVSELSGRLLDAAADCGADAVVAACPLCQMNLDMRQGQVNRSRGSRHSVPVFYFTQLMGLAFGLNAEEVGLSKLVVDPNPCLRAAGVL
ncbi:CoB--CoM heterodisulfide reductase iron-sulfur subunit B family protein [Oleidesulfovibrio sp.]|uniref:CoB--CoM heterodisulfide reductase iron-sulfur subunit B family protein n=1 Tax=Oleidesulfovibrio sp. TaxID=2909707 RepID=UPI003A888CCD